MRYGQSPYTGESKRYSAPDGLKNSTTLFVGNLSFNIQEKHLRAFMEKCGVVKTITVGKKGYGFVEFATRADAEKIHEQYQGIEYDGRPLRLDWDLGFQNKQKNWRFTKKRSPRPYFREFRNRSRSTSRSPRWARRSRSRSRSRSFKRKRSISNSRSPKRQFTHRTSRSSPRSSHHRSPPRRSPSHSPSRQRHPSSLVTSNGNKGKSRAAHHSKSPPSRSTSRNG